MPDVVPALVDEKRLRELVHELDAVGALFEALLEEATEKWMERALVLSAGAVEKPAPLGVGCKIESRRPKSL